MLQKTVVGNIGGVIGKTFPEVLFNLGKVGGVDNKVKIVFFEIR